MQWCIVRGSGRLYYIAVFRPVSFIRSCRIIALNPYKTVITILVLAIAAIEIAPGPAPVFADSPPAGKTEKRAGKDPGVPAERIVVHCSECPEPISASAPHGVHYGTVTVYLKSLGTELSGFSVSLIRRSDGETIKTRESDLDGAAPFYGVPAGEYLALLHRTGAKLRPNLSTTIGDIVVKFAQPGIAAEREIEKPEAAPENE